MLKIWWRQNISLWFRSDFVGDRNPHFFDVSMPYEAVSSRFEVVKISLVVVVNDYWRKNNGKWRQRSVSQELFFHKTVGTDHFFVIITATHRQPPFLAASHSATSRLTSLGSVETTSLTALTTSRFWSLDSVACRSHSSLPVVLSFPARQRILLFPFLPLLCRQHFVIFTSVAFRSS